MTDDTDGPYDMTPAEALDSLGDMSGQRYITPDRAFNHIAVLAGGIEDSFVATFSNFYDGDEEGKPDMTDRRDALSRALIDIQKPAAEARGLVNVWPHEQIVVVAEVSGLLVEAIGEDPSDYTAGGAGFTMDGRHDRNMATLRDHYDVPAEA